MYMCFWILVGRSEIKFQQSENIWKELDVNEICFMEWAHTTLKLQVRERNLFMHNCEAKCGWISLLAPEDMKIGQG